MDITSYLFNKGLPEVSYRDFYRDIFPKNKLYQNFSQSVTYVLTTKRNCSNMLKSCIDIVCISI